MLDLKYAFCVHEILGPYNNSRELTTKNIAINNNNKNKKYQSQFSLSRNSHGFFVHFI